MIQIASIVGARPQMIKAAPVTRAVEASDQITQVLVHTGQHYDDNMSAVFFEELDLPQPDYELGIGSGSHGAQTGRMLAAIEEALVKIGPDWVLLYGDTNSTLAGALAAAKMHIRVAHVEAGLRSFNRWMPEEINRVVADHVSDLLFAPTRAAVENLKKEGIDDKRLELVGDVMYDATLFYAKRADEQSHILKDLGLESGEYVLATVHRAENTDAPRRLQAILEGLGKVSEQVAVVLPLHPRTRKYITEQGIDVEKWASLRVIDAVGYLDMTQLEANARAIATDSGGVQKEAYFHKVRCVTMREETEWVELVEARANRLAPPDSPAQISDAILDALNAGRWEETGPLYGDGNAAGHIVELLIQTSN